MSDPTQPESPDTVPVVPPDSAPPAPDTPPAVTNRLAQIKGATRTVDPFGRPRRHKVAIVGFTDHRSQAPFGDPEWEIWGLNELYRYMPVEQFSRWFELHNRTDFEAKKDYAGDPPHIETINAFPLPVFTNAPWPNAPPTIVLPKEHIERACGTSYFTSSIAWMIGLAILEEFSTIGVYGVDMAQDTEYAEQKACCEYLIGFARGKGITVTVPPTSDLLAHVGQYGFGEEGNAFAKKTSERIDWLMREHGTQEARLAQLEKEYLEKKGQVKIQSDHLDGQYRTQKDTITATLRQIEGAVDDCKFWKRSWGIKGAAAAPNAPPNPIERAGMSKLAPFVSVAQGGDSK